MTKKEFDETDEPLAMIVSLDPKTGKVLFDTYPYETADSWMDDFRNDFPDMMHFKKVNKAAIEDRKKALGFTD